MRPTLRRASAADRAAVRALCERLDPTDYVPAAWDDWLADEGGEMLLAESGGTLVGCLYAAVVAPGQVFSQALRVDPAARRMKVATALMAEQARRLRERGIAIQRGVTAMRNARARAFFASAGWREARLTHRRRLPEWRGARADAPAQSGNALPAALLTSRAGRAHFRRIYYAAARHDLERAAHEGRWHARDGAHVLVDPPSPEFGTWVSALGGPPEALLALLRDLPPAAGAPPGLTVEAPDDPAIVAALDALGVAPPSPADSYVVVECPLQVG